MTTCRSRAVFSFTVDGSNFCQVECLTPYKLGYNPVSSEVQAGESIVVGTFQPEPRSVACLAVFTAALIRDTLREKSIDLLSDACCRPRWRVMLADLQDWHLSLREPNTSDLGNQRPLLSMGPDGQSCITGLPRRICWRRAKPVPRLMTWPHPWQCQPPLSTNDTIDLLNHFPSLLPCPAGWEVLQRNGRVLVTAPGCSSVLRVGRTGLSTIRNATCTVRRATRSDRTI